jgi:flagellar hook-associated protein 1 FlgK
MTTKLEAVRDSISAVNLDEEMTNMIKFQHAYTAASKLISVADELLTSLLATK